MQNKLPMDLQDYKTIESGYMTIGFKLKSMKSKSGPKTIDYIQNMLSNPSNQTYIEDNKLHINYEDGKHIELDISPEKNIGTTLYYTKSKGFIGVGERTFLIDLKHQQKLFEENHHKEENQCKTQNPILKDENKGSLRLESITEWLEENKSKIKKKKKPYPETSDISDQEKKEEEINKNNKTINKPIKKRKKNMNRLLNRLK